MKPVEFVDEIDEGFLKSAGKAIGGALAKQGFLGGKAQQKYFRQQGVEQDYEAEKEDFIDGLEKNLEGAINAGSVATSAIPESVTFKDFNRLFENQFLAEAVSVSQFVKMYAMNWAKKNGIDISPAEEPQLDKLSSDFEQIYASKGWQEDSAKKIFDLVVSTRSVQGGRPAAPTAAPGGPKIGTRHGNPKKPVTLDIKGQDYKWDGKQWTDEAGNAITDPEDVELLNKTAYDQAKAGAATAPGQPTQPSQPAQSAQPTQPGQPTQTGRKVKDIENIGANSFQYTGDPGKEWLVVNGPLLTPDPMKDKYNGVQTVGSKRYISASDMKKNFGLTEAMKKKLARKYGQKSIFETLMAREKVK